MAWQDTFLNGFLLWQTLCFHATLNYMYLAIQWQICGFKFRKEFRAKYAFLGHQRDTCTTCNDLLWRQISGQATTSSYHPSIHPSIVRQRNWFASTQTVGRYYMTKRMTIPSSRREDDDVDDNKPWCIIIKHPSSCLVFFFSFILTIDPITCCSYSWYCSIYGTIKRSLHSVAEEEDLKVILNGIRKSWNVLCLCSRIKELKPFNIIIRRTSFICLLKDPLTIVLVTKEIQTRSHLIQLI